MTTVTRKTHHPSPAPVPARVPAAVVQQSHAKAVSRPGAPVASLPSVAEQEAQLHQTGGGIQRGSVTRGGVAASRGGGVLGFLIKGSAPSSDLAAAFPKVRSERSAGYPQRFPVDAAHASWDAPMKDYQPAYHVDAKVLAQDNTRTPGGWAQPEDFHQVKMPASSYVGTLRKDAQGRPLNPMGRTGIEGRGLLGKWGPNFAADPMVMWFDGKDLKMLLIQRKETVVRNGVEVHPWAIPGGMADEGEAMSGTLARELKEETGIALDLSEKSGARTVYKGPVDDPRSTDHAWIETTAAYRMMPADDGKRIQDGMKAMDDAMGVKAVTLSHDVMSTLYASHGSLVGKALQDMLERPDVDAQVKEKIRQALG